VSTYGLDKNVNNITKVIEVDYRRPEIPKKEKIENAIRLRKAYIRRTKKSKYRIHKRKMLFLY
jgi:hypothetical protein